MSNLAICPADHLPMLEAIAATYPVRLEGIVVVPNIGDWALERGIHDTGVRLRDHRS